MSQLILTIDHYLTKHHFKNHQTIPLIVILKNNSCFTFKTLLIIYNMVQSNYQEIPKLQEMSQKKTEFYGEKKRSPTAVKF